MKAALFGVLRHLLIPLAFIWSLGIFNIRFPTKGANNTYAFDSTDFSTMEINPQNVERYSDSIITIRKEAIKQGKLYTPYVYFRDLKQFKMFEVVYGDSLNQTPRGRGYYLRFVGGLGIVSQLTALRDETWRNVDFDAMENEMSIAEAREHWFANQEAQLRANNEKTEKFFWSNLWNWLVSSYFKGMGVAFLLFLIWIKRFKKNHTSDQRYEELKQLEHNFSILSFMYALLVWPIILIRDIRNRTKDTLLKAEVLSRRKDMFSLFSKEEKQLIKLGRKIGLRDFRKQLDEQGLTRKRSLFTALCILPILTVYSHQLVQTQDQYVSSTVSVSAKVCVDDDVGTNVHLAAMCIPEKLTLPLVLIKKEVIFFKNIFKILKGFLKKPKDVPKCFTCVLSKS